MIVTYVGEPAAYFYAVARNVAHEARRREEIGTDKIPEKINVAVETSDTYDCLVEGLKVLPSDKCELMLDYYVYPGKDKITHHRRMTQALEVTQRELRSRT